jgi:hypothetical protein
MTILTPLHDGPLYERVLELDHAIRSALAENDGETARDLIARFFALLPAFMKPDGAEQPGLGNLVIDMLQTQREQAEALQERVRAKLNELARQRCLVEGQRTSRPPRSQRSFIA